MISVSNSVLPLSRNESGLDWSVKESFRSSKKSWITFSKAVTFSSESKFFTNEFSKSPTNFFTLKKDSISLIKWIEKVGDWQWLVVLLSSSWFCPESVVTSVVEGADEALDKREEPSRGHRLLLEITWNGFKCETIQTPLYTDIHGDISWVPSVLQGRGL